MKRKPTKKAGSSAAPRGGKYPKRKPTKKKTAAQRKRETAALRKKWREQNAPKDYKIVRFRRTPSTKKGQMGSVTRRTIKSNLTLKEAKAHTNDPKTEGKDWFDGFAKMDKKK